MRELESLTYCTLLPPEESDIVKETRNAGRFHSDMEEIKPDMERGSPHIWFFNAMLKSTDGTSKTESGELSLLGQGKAEALGTLRIVTDEGGSRRAEHGDKGMQASPSFRNAWAVTQVAGHFGSGRIHAPLKEEAARKGGEPPLRAFGGDTGNAGRGAKKEENKDSGLGQAHNDTVRSGSPCGESPARESGKGAGQGDRLGKRRGKGRKESVPIVSDGNNQQTALTRRLLKRWRSRRQRVSEQPKSKRESGLADKRESSGPTR